jgi:hypothetical protein
MEEVAHAVHENPSWLLPSQRQVKLIGMERYVETMHVAAIAHGLKALREPLRITEFTARRDLRAARDRIPRRIGPLNSAVVTHSGSKTCDE